VAERVIVLIMISQGWSTRCNVMMVTVTMTMMMTVINTSEFGHVLIFVYGLLC